MLDIQKWAISETIYKIGVSRALGSNRNFQQFEIKWGRVGLFGDLGRPVIDYR